MQFDHHKTANLNPYKFSFSFLVVLMLFDTHSLHISSTVLAGIIVGGGTICIILIVVCILCLCCGRRNEKGRKLVHVKNPPDATEKGDPTLDWPTRLKVAIGAAKGLAYMHEDCHPRIIHRDIKAANILLDKDFQAKVADFGLAKFSLEADTHVTTRVMGTLGYLSPEYASTGKLSEKSDVYSFGVVLLELITGRRPVDRKQKENNLVTWARPLLTSAIEDENFNSLLDPRLQYCYNRSEMARTVSCAASCVRKSAKLRPQMSQVLRALEGNVTLSELSEGLTPGRSLVPKRYNSNQQNKGSKHQGDSAGFLGPISEYSESQYVSSEVDGSTGEYGLYTIEVLERK